MNILASSDPKLMKMPPFNSSQLGESNEYNLINYGQLVAEIFVIKI